MTEDEAHPAAETLERFMRGELSREEMPAVVRHLLTGCPQCVAVTRRVWARGDMPLALRILLAEGLAWQAEASRERPFCLRWSRGEEP